MQNLVALYARVSTPQQKEEATIESQIAAIEIYAQSQEYSLCKDWYFVDQAVSGSRLDRPALNRLRDLAPEGLFSILLCLSPDRLARQYVHQSVLMNELQRCGVKVVFINQPQLDETPQSHFFLGIQGLFAEYERAMITERLRRGKLYRVQQGQVVHPVAPYGYRYVPVSQPGGGQWEVNPLEAPVVEQIYQWYAQDNLTIWQIVSRLEALGSKEAPPRGEHWQYSTVHRILNQAAYTGQAYYNRTRTNYDDMGRLRKIGRGRTTTPSHTLRPKEEWVSVQVPNILSSDLWRQAQERLTMNKQFAQRNNAKHFYLLRSLLVCHVCGHTLVGRTTGARRTYGCCHGGNRRSPDVPKHSCIIEAPVVEPLVWQAVTVLLDNPQLILDAWESQSQSDQGEDGEAERLTKRDQTLERQWQRLLDLFVEEAIDKSEWVRRKETIDQERQTLQQRLNVLETQLAQTEAKEQMFQDFETYCQHIQSGLENPTPELQQEVIRLLIDHIVVGEDEICIKHIVPTNQDCRLLPGRR